jgi:hypothetical protein
LSGLDRSELVGHSDIVGLWMQTNRQTRESLGGQRDHRHQATHFVMAMWIPSDE